MRREKEFTKFTEKEESSFNLLEHVFSSSVIIIIIGIIFVVSALI